MEESILLIFDIINKHIDSYSSNDVTKCNFYITTTPTYVIVHDTIKDFNLVIHSNKNLIKSNCGGNKIDYRLEYNYFDVLIRLYSLDDSIRLFFPPDLETEIYNKLTGHQRMLVIDGIIEETEK